MSTAIGGPASPPVSAAVSTSFRDAFKRPFFFFSHEAKSAPPLPVPESPKETFSEDDSEDSLDVLQAAELLYSAQDDIISHDYAEAIKKLTKSARYGNSAACAYLSKYAYSRPFEMSEALRRTSILTHGLDCSDHEHEEDRIDANPPAAARWAIRGLEVELGKSPELPVRRSHRADEVPFASDGQSTPSATPSEAGPFDLQAAADCANTLTLLFRTRKVHAKVDDVDRKGKSVNLVDAAMRISRLMLQHDAVTTPMRTYSQEKMRRIINVNLLYLVALLEAAADNESEAEGFWKRVTAVGEEGPLGDNAADELVGNARRRLILLQNQRRDSDDGLKSPVAREVVSQEQRPSSFPMRRASSSSSRKAKFELGAEDATSPMSEKSDPMTTNYLRPPSPRSAHAARKSKRLEAKAAKSPPQPTPARFLSLKTISCIFKGNMPGVAPASVAVEAGSVYLPPQEKLRSRTSFASMMHDTLPASKSMLFTFVRREKSAASLPELVASRSESRFPRLRAWSEMNETNSVPDATDALREALRKHDFAFAETNLDVDENLESDSETEGEDQKQMPTTSRPVKVKKRPAAPMPASTQTFRIKGVDPALAKLEDSSRVNVMSVCAVCDAKGVNFPRCPKCRQTYCSRACRIGGGGDGERHVCRDPSSEPLTPISEPPPVYNGPSN